jgi:Zn-dependent alcohol dehydrogenase
VKRKRALRRRYGHTHAALRAHYGHAFAADVKKVGEKIRKLMQDHPTATAALTGAGVASGVGGMTTGAAAAIGATAGVVSSELSRKHKD